MGFVAKNQTRNISCDFDQNIIAEGDLTESSGGHYCPVGDAALPGNAHAVPLYRRVWMCDYPTFPQLFGSGCC